MKLRKITHKKAQIDFPILTLIIVVFGLLVLAPFILKILNSFSAPFGEAVGNMSEQAGTNVAYITNSFVGFWDFVILIGFLINVILLFITSFLVDTHPVFLVLFILFGFFTFIFAPTLLDVVNKIYDDPNFALEVSQIQMVDFLREYFGIILLGIFVVCGIIIFSKFKWGGQTS